MSLVVGIVNNILLNAVDARAEVICLKYNDERTLEIFFDGEVTGSLPLEQGEGVLCRFLVLANQPVPSHLTPFRGELEAIVGETTRVVWAVSFSPKQPGSPLVLKLMSRVEE